MSKPEIKAGAKLLNIQTKERITVDRVDLKGAYLNGSTKPVPVFHLINKVNDRILVKA